MFISTEIAQAISLDMHVLTQDNIDKAKSLDWSMRKFLFAVFYTTQDHRDSNFFGDGIGTRGTYTLDVKDEHIFSMMKYILKYKGLSY